MEQLASDPEVKSFIIDEVHRPSESESRSLGSGSYGSVELLVVGSYRLKCAGKSIHNILLEAGNEGVDNIKHRFIRECKLMSSLRHPNIVQFLGICFLSESSLPVLLMEYMNTNLASVLEAPQVLPLPVKISILHDVSQGLAYLHHHNPPVIHRDLTATNVLLNSALSAKIADFGNSRLVHITPDHKTMTRVPGTLAYLPPEALDPKPKYDAKLDSFSFGHLTLYTMTGVFPMPSASTFLDPETKKVIGRTEVERREDFLQSMEVGNKSDCDAVKQLIVDCLSNDPTNRPSSMEIMGIIQQLKRDNVDSDVLALVRKCWDGSEKKLKHLESSLIEVS